LPFSWNPQLFILERSACHLARGRGRFSVPDLLRVRLPAPTPSALHSYRLARRKRDVVGPGFRLCGPRGNHNAPGPNRCCRCLDI
jgi:hypothetical protein